MRKTQESVEDVVDPESIAQQVFSHIETTKPVEEKRKRGSQLRKSRMSHTYALTPQLKNMARSMGINIPKKELKKKKEKG